MRFIQPLVFMLITAGLFIIFKVNPVELISSIFNPLRSSQKLRERARIIAGKKAGIIQGQINRAQEMLDSAGMGGDVRNYEWASIVLAMIGFGLGLLSGIYPLAVILAIGMALIPVIYIQFRTADYIKGQNETMETALSVVTNSYMQSGDIEDAIRTTVHNIPSPIDEVYRGFLVDVQMIDSNVVRALNNMSDKIDRRHFKEWCSILIQCQGDRELRYALPSLVERLSELRQVQMEVDTVTSRAYKEFGIIVLIVLSSIPIVAMMIPGWFYALVHTLAGQITLCIMAITIIFTVMRITKFAKPLDMD